MQFADRYGPWAIIAGASEGTGRSLALKIAARGINCILIARREAPLKALSDQIRAETGAQTVVASVDLAAPDALERIKAAVGAREVGLFVGNAGADPNGARFLEREIGVWLELTQRNVVTTMMCCHHFAQAMKERGRGGLLLVNSGACYGGASVMAVYSAGKAFTLCLGEGLWAELRPHGVDVLNLVLGRTDTPAFRKLLAEKGVPVPDNIASPDEVAEVGLARLAHGTVHNWGVPDDAAGFAPNSAAARRERILKIDTTSQQVFGKSR
jgi:short-subunit dehydrogenase